MKSTVRKRSLLISGHKTSISLEDGFWHALQEIAHSQGRSISELVRIIEANRDHHNLSSAVRLHVLEYYRAIIRSRREAA